MTRTGELTTFDGGTAEAWRIDARRRWAGALPGDAPEGWSTCPVDPAVIMPAFPSLALRPAYRLAAYLYRAGRNCNAAVYALAAAAELPAPQGAAKPPAPPGALDDPLSAVEGDGSAASYLQASMLARELEEFGAVGHGMVWSFAFVLGDDVWDDPGDVSPSRRRPTLAPEQYHWTSRMPDEFSPTVAQDGRVVVRFLTYSALGSEQITEHVDVYDPGGYVMRTRAEVLATSDRGFRI